MDKRILITVFALVAVIVGVLVVFATTRGGETVPPTGGTTSQPSSSPPSTAEPSTTPTAQVTPGAYVDYSETAIQNAEGRVLLFFHAPWCPQCRSIESDILAAGVPDGVTIIKIDYDSNQALRQQYGVTLQTTFVEVDSAGGALQTHVAYDDPHLAAVVEAML